MEGTDAAVQASKIKASSGGDDDHGGDAEFEEGRVIAEQRVWLRGGEDLIGCRGGCHLFRIQGMSKISLSRRFRHQLTKLIDAAPEE